MTPSFTRPPQCICASRVAELKSYAHRKLAPADAMRSASDERGSMDRAEPTHVYDARQFRFARRERRSVSPATNRPKSRASADSRFRVSNQRGNSSRSGIRARRDWPRESTASRRDSSSLARKSLGRARAAEPVFRSELPRQRRRAKARLLKVTRKTRENARGYIRERGVH